MSVDTAGSKEEAKAMVDYAKNLLFRYRWAGQTTGLQEMILTIKNDPDWHKSENYKALTELLRPMVIDSKVVERDLRGAPLSGADLVRANLSRTDLLKANLCGAHLKEANLSGANLWGADLSRASLRGANLSGANLWGANLCGADLCEANLSGTNLCEANLSKADLWKANLCGAHLRGANLSGTNLWGTDLSGADLGEVSYTTDELFNRLVRWWCPKVLRSIPFMNCIKPIREWRPIGITNFRGVDTTKFNGSRNPVLKRHIEDYQFIQGFRGKSWVHEWLFYPLWKCTSDCGRSLLLWFLWSVGFVGLFAVVHARHLADWFNQVNLKSLSVWYFSIIKFTTLGFGGLSPRIENPAAQTWVMAEVVMGYIMLGGLISIFANKLARRA
jgi:uncharacterized protein YjbI with pentapeptide repeats